MRGIVATMCCQQKFIAHQRSKSRVGAHNFESALAFAQILEKFTFARASALAIRERHSAQRRDA